MTAPVCSAFCAVVLVVYAQPARAQVAGGNADHDGGQAPRFPTPANLGAIGESGDFSIRVRLNSYYAPYQSTLSYTRNLLGQIRSVSGGPSNVPLATGFDYDAAGRTTRIDYRAGLSDSFGYDSLGRLETINLIDSGDRVPGEPISWNTFLPAPGAGPLRAWFQYSPAGNVLKEVYGSAATACGMNQRCYGYDGLHRLTSTTGAGREGRMVNLAYRYDASGNVLSVSGTGGTNVSFNYEGTSNRFAGLPAGSYDSHGNLLQINGRTHAYDVLGRLVTASRGDAFRGSYTYDAQGRKSSRTAANGSTEIYVYSIGGQVLASFTPSGTWTNYVLADGRRIGEISQTGAVSYYHTDALGSVRAVSRPNGTVEWRDYLPYGESSTQASSPTRFGYTGQEFDDGLGIYDYSARYYDPALYRFIQVDSYMGTATDPLSLNRFAYVHGNPLRYTDPTGHCIRKQDGTTECETQVVQAARPLTPESVMNAATATTSAKTDRPSVQTQIHATVARVEPGNIRLSARDNSTVILVQNTVRSATSKPGDVVQNMGEFLWSNTAAYDTTRINGGAYSYDERGMGTVPLGDMFNGQAGCGPVCVEYEVARQQAAAAVGIGTLYVTAYNDSSGHAMTGTIDASGDTLIYSWGNAPIRGQADATRQLGFNTWYFRPAATDLGVSIAAGGGR